MLNGAELAPFCSRPDQIDATILVADWHHGLVCLAIGVGRSLRWPDRGDRLRLLQDPYRFGEDHASDPGDRPAGGRCVRLRQGDFEQETVFGDDPAAMAARWESEGAGANSSGRSGRCQDRSAGQRRGGSPDRAAGSACPASLVVAYATRRRSPRGSRPDWIGRHRHPGTSRSRLVRPDGRQHIPAVCCLVWMRAMDEWPLRAGSSFRASPP